MLWAGRRYVMGRKAICYGPEGNMLWAGRQYVLDQKVVAWKGAFVVGIFGGISLSFRAYSCGFMFSGSQESVARQRRDRTVPRVDVL